MKLSNNLFLKIFLVLIISTAAVFPAAADNGVNIIATNSWTAAFVKMAGGEAVQLAPSNMEHPPEYELKPSDVLKIKNSDLLVYAGYEVLMKTVFDSFDIPEDKIIRIDTSYSPELLEKSIMLIAERLGTSAEAEKNISEYRAALADSRSRLKQLGRFGAPVLVQFHQKPLATALGFEILGVFGPQPLEVRQIAELGQTKPVLIIDNAHSPMSAPLEEILGIDAVELVNFPGYSLDDGTTVPVSLTGVLQYNVKELIH